MIQLSKNSVAKLNTCNNSIVEVINEAAKVSPLNFQVSLGAIDVEKLQRMFNKKQSVINPKSFVDKVLKTKVKYKKELFTKVPNLVESKSDKSKSVEILCDSNSVEDAMIVVGAVLSTANRILKEETLKFSSRKGGYITFILV